MTPPCVDLYAYVDADVDVDVVLDADVVAVVCLDVPRSPYKHTTTSAFASTTTYTFASTYKSTSAPRAPSTHGERSLTEAAMKRRERLMGCALVAPRRRRGVRLLFFQVAALPRFARERLVAQSFKPGGISSQGSRPFGGRSTAPG